MNLIVEKKNVYGVERVYPVCKKAKLFARISGNKTLLDEDRTASQRTQRTTRANR